MNRSCLDKRLNDLPAAELIKLLAAKRSAIPTKVYRAEYKNSDKARAKPILTNLVNSPEISSIREVVKDTYE